MQLGKKGWKIFQIAKDFEKFTYIFMKPLKLSQLMLTLQKLQHCYQQLIFIIHIELTINL